jgi:hypothetical protein
MWLVRIEGAPDGDSSLARGHYPRVASARIVPGKRGPTKLQQLREQIGQGGQSLEEVERIARSIGAWEDRFAARPAAEMLIEQGAPGADVMRKAIGRMPFTGTDQRAEILREACRSAMTRDGIPPDVERLARAFYEKGRSRGQPRPTAAPVTVMAGGTDAYAPIQPTGSLDIFSAIAKALRRLFGR